MGNNYDFVLEYDLIAQSPMIHFQADAFGSTLRATEVKPKLDRYLIKKAKAVDFDIKPFIKSHNALDYKLTIEQVPKENNGTEIKNSLGFLYYGNNKAIFENTRLKIVCFYDKLREFINKNIIDFFIVTNFGTSQNKGFGSFIIKDTPEVNFKIAKVLKDYYGAKSVYTFNFNKKQDDFSDAFAKIKTVYALMKSGINFRGTYQRSLLFEYMHEQYQMGNEKQFLKKMRVAPAIGKRPQNENQSNHKNYYVRALLGTSGNVTFQGERGGREIITYKNNEIERFPSTVFFKIIGNTIYMVPTEIDNSIFNKKFVMFNKKTKKQCFIFTPSKDQIPDSFLEDFLEYAVGRINDQNSGIKKKFRDISNINIQKL